MESYTLGSFERFRFMQKVGELNAETGCMEWNATRMKSGHGSFWVGNSPQSAHRIAYELFRGIIPKVDFDGKRVLVRHKCDNPPCVNPGTREQYTEPERQVLTQEVGREFI